MTRILTKAPIRFAVLTIVLLLTSGFSSLEALFAPAAELWPKWEAHDAKSTKTIDHGAWDRFLKAYVKQGASGLNLVAYKKVSASDKAALKAYLQQLTSTSVSSLNRGEQLAFWINLYNAKTIDIILDHYPVKSIKDIKIGGGFFSSGVWSAKLLQVEGEELTLNDVEHRILRPIWKDPRIHYAVNCASIGCPNLLPRAFTKANVDKLMDEGARAYINSDRGIKVTDQGLILSKIFTWFSSDFGSSDAEVIAHLKKYATGPRAEKLSGKVEIADYAYDWSLNETK